MSVAAVAITLLVASQPADAAPVWRTAPAPVVVLAPPVDAPAEDAVADEGAVVVRARSKRGDPAEAVNVKAFEATEAVDKTVIGPIALAYRDNLPKPVRRGLRNFLSNLREPINAINFLLQLKPGKAGAAVGRFAINTTVGVAGLIDIAKRRPFGLPRRANGFANTLGYYGVKPGPYLFLPLIGSTTVRDLVGVVVDQTVLPYTLFKPLNERVVTLPAAVLTALDKRAELDEELERQRATDDPYGARRKFYLDRRQREIDALHGRTSQPVIVPALLADSALVTVPER